MPPVKKPAAAKAAGTGRVVNLDKARAERVAARAEADREPVTLILHGQQFALPVEMPLDFAALAQQGDIRGAVAALLGAGADEFFALAPSLGDFTELAEQAATVYGLEPGEAAASPNS